MSGRKKPTPGAGAYLISVERQRQVEEEGRSLQGDLCHPPETLAQAAMAYACPPGMYKAAGLDHSRSQFWPWNPISYKDNPNPDRVQRIRELVKAGALIAAEIDRYLGAKPEVG